MITYNFKVTNLVPEDEGSLSKVVKEVHFFATAIDDEDGVSSEYSGICYLESPDSASFTAYDDLSESQVFGWCFAQNSEANIKRDLDNMIANQRITNQRKAQRPRSQEMPWSTAAE